MPHCFLFCFFVAQEEPVYRFRTERAVLVLGPAMPVTRSTTHDIYIFLFSFPTPNFVLNSHDTRWITPTHTCMQHKYGNCAHQREKTNLVVRDSNGYASLGLQKLDPSPEE